MQLSEPQERAALFLEHLDANAIQAAAQTVSAIKAIRHFDDAVLKEIVDALFIRAAATNSAHSDSLHEIAEVIEEGMPTLESIAGDYK